EPEIHAGGHAFRNIQIVVRKEDYGHVFLENLLHPEDLLDQYLSVVVAGMRFAGAQDLKTADVPANPPELLDVGKKKIRALIGRNAPRKANGEDFLVEVDLTLCAGVTKQFRLRLHVRCPEYVFANALALAQPDTVPPTSRDVPL